MKANSITVFNFIKDNDGKNFTAADIAEATGLTAKSVNGINTKGLQYKDDDGNVVALAERVPAELELADGTHKAVKFIRLTEAGKGYTPVDD